MRYAAIDIGSNAVRLLIADIVKDNKEDTYTFKKNTLLRIPLRLGEDAFNKQQISANKADQLVKTMRAFKDLMDVFQVTDYMACATSAMRDAKNGDEIAARVKALGIDLQIIEGAWEAEIIYNSHLDHKLDADKVYLFIDVGGGSTELSLFAEERLVASKSFNLGTIRILDNKDHSQEWEAMNEWVAAHSKSFDQIIGIGTGGNINKLSKLLNEKEDKPISLQKMRTLYAFLSSYSLKDRIAVLGLNEDRADVIIPAAQIFLAVMKAGHLKQIQVPRVGLVDGVIQTLIKRNLID
ncbi:exopolyphosphatase [Sphingobacteriaceae bacterium WQ 2009]|uniref:Exopolyphosphatase n=1 Tax=Rhinopithecimicrobium faecis TaxID=2820698 RepID=A0A8T4HCC4_9SPHI|nr:exopolyphosphatase [Sphingobacteriaceae bacterium WQ 2009]